MNQPIFYNDQCPSCGRPLQVGIQHFGQEVTCQHCAKSFCSVGNGSEANTELKQKIDDLIGPEEQHQSGEIQLAVYSD